MSIYDQNQCSSAAAKEGTKASDPLSTDQDYAAHMERRCKTLSDMVIYWREQTKVLYERSRKAVAEARAELEAVRGQAGTEKERMREDCTRALLQCKTEYMAV